jgi:Ca2+-binding RTX toxin-like protein
VILVGASACGSGIEEPEAEDPGEIALRDGSHLTLTTECAFDATSKQMTVTVQATERATIARRTDGAILVNGSQCKTATALNVKRLVVVESAAARGDESVTLDMNTGLFAPGDAAGAGIRIDLGSGNDTVLFIGRETADNIVAGAGGVSLNGDTFKDMTVASTGTLTYQFTLRGGNDVFSAQGTTSGTGAALNAPTLVYGGAGDDKLTGGSGADKLFGDDGNDTIKGELGNDTCEGGAGTDVFDESRPATGSNGNDVYSDSAGSGDKVDYSTRKASIVADIEPAATGSNDDGEVALSEADQLDPGIDILVSGSGNDTLTGDANANTLTGGEGNDILSGGDGNDVLNGDAGNDLFREGSAANGADVFNGGLGSDTIDYSSRSTDLLITMGNLVADDGELSSLEADNVKSDVEHCNGGSGSDDISGNTSDNVLSGGDGADILRGGAGADRFDEGTASNGGDAFIGGAGYDTVDYSKRSEDLTVTMALGSDDGESGENDRVANDVEVCNGGSGADHLTGSELDEELNGGDGNDTLRGGAGNDVLSGDAGDDSLEGESGDDVLDGGGGTDTLVCGAGSDIGYNGESTTSCEL